MTRDRSCTVIYYEKVVEINIRLARIIRASFV